MGFEQALITLGQDLICPQDVARHRGCRYADRERKLEVLLPKPHILRMCREQGYVMVPGPPIRHSIRDLYDHFDPNMFLPGRAWYLDEKQKFASSEMTEFQWIVLRKSPPADSLDKQWSAQQSLVPNNCFVPNAATVAWALTTYRSVHQEALMPDFAVRTSSVSANGDNVYVGFDGETGLNIWHIDPYQNDAKIGIAICRSI